MASPKFIQPTYLPPYLILHILHFSRASSKSIYPTSACLPYPPPSLWPILSKSDSCQTTPMVHLLQELFHTSHWITPTSSWLNLPTPSFACSFTASAHHISLPYILPRCHETDQANFKSLPSQITTPPASLTKSNFAVANWNPSPTTTLPQHNLCHVLHWFLYYVLPIQPHGSSSRYTKPHSKQSHPHGKTNQCLTNTDQCLTNDFKI